MSKESIQATFKVRRTRQIIISLLALACVVVMLYVNANPNEALWGLSSLQVVIFALVAVVGLLAASFWNWRCPNCNKYLGRGWNPKQCPNCKTELR